MTTDLDQRFEAQRDEQSARTEAPVVVYFGAGRSQIKAAFEDVLSGLKQWRLWISLASLDVKQRYRRAVLGPFWITISMAILVVTLGIVYSGLFKQDVHSFLPYLATGFIVWNFCTGTINDSMTVFVQAEGLIKQGGLPLSLYVFRTIFRNFIINAHNLAVMVLLYIWQPALLNWHLLLLVPGLLLMLMNFAWGSIIIGVFCTRFRDLPQIVANILQILFFVTPVMYRPETLPARLSLLVQLNPFYYLIEAVRAPLLGSSPPHNTYIALTLFFIAGSSLTFWFFGRTRVRIAYWL
jgi:ABC-2 type transport system permease protein